jgi:hypothetical protein
MRDTDLKLRNTMVDWLKLDKFDRAFAVTLTLKQNVGSEKLSKLSAQKNLRVFLNRLNRGFYGNAGRRYNRKIETVPVLGRSFSGRLHYHLILLCPENAKEHDFCEMIRILWLQTNFGHRETKIEKITSNGWLEYMANHIFSAGEFDYENMYINY